MNLSTFGMIFSFILLLIPSLSFANRLEEFDFTQPQSLLFQDGALQKRLLKSQRKYVQVLQDLDEQLPEQKCEGLNSKYSYAISSHCYHDLNLQHELSMEFLKRWISMDQAMISILSENQNMQLWSQVLSWIDGLESEIQFLHSLLPFSKTQFELNSAFFECEDLKKANTSEYEKRQRKNAFQKQTREKKKLPRHVRFHFKSLRDIKRQGFTQPVRLDYSSGELLAMAEESRFIFPSANQQLHKEESKVIVQELQINSSGDEGEDSSIQSLDSSQLSESSGEQECLSNGDQGSDDSMDSCAWIIYSGDLSDSDQTENDLL